MVHTQALILKTFLQHDQKALVLDEKHGKVMVKLGAFSKISLCQGMLVQGNLFVVSNSSYSLKNIDPVFAPFDQACHDIEFLHSFLFALHKTIPLHAHFSGIIEYTKYVYSVFSYLTEYQKKMVLLFIFLKGDVFPEEPWLYALLVNNVFTIHELVLDERMQQKVAHTFSLCWEQISHNKNT
jgi:hypothetical protein